MKVQRILARNPGPYTGPGTNTYLVGDDTGLAVIDPGPVDDAHLESIVGAVGDTPVESVIVTHTHIDHAPLANPLASMFGVPAMGFLPGPYFEPDVRLGDGDTVAAGAVVMTAVHTPGHADDHLCFLAGSTLFTGDHIMGGSSVMVENLAPYLESLRRLQQLQLDRLHPGHGPDIENPQEVISWYLAHRLERERQIIELVSQGDTTIGQVVEEIYVDVDVSLHPLAARSVGAHVRKLADDGIVRIEGEGWSARIEPLSTHGPE